MRDFDHLMCHQYHLGGLPEENQYFIAATRDVILVRPSNPDDHVGWLLENELYKKAMEFARENERSLQNYNATEVGRSYLENLISSGEFDEAAKLCPSICGNRKDFWEEYVNRFEQVRQARLLAPYLPTQSPQLEPECYEMILLEFLRSDVPGFKKLARLWSRDLYRVGAIIKETLERLYRQTSEETLSASDRADLLETLAQLYTYERNYERALAIYMKVGSRNVFPLVEQFNLFPMVKDRIHELMWIDKDLAVRLLLNNEDSLPAATVVKQLSRQPELQLAYCIYSNISLYTVTILSHFWGGGGSIPLNLILEIRLNKFEAAVLIFEFLQYLDRLFARGEGADFADLAISLYAEKDRKRLLPFLRNNEHYKLDKALEICRQRNLIPEIVFLLGRSGNRREALKVIIRDSGDIYQAIEFCKEHDDSDLWQDLIDYSLMKPKFVTILMENIGTHVDPTLLIRKIPDRMEILGLRESLVKILQDFQMQISLREGCERVLVSDCHSLMKQTVKFRHRGTRIGLDDVCSVCGKCLVQTDPRYAENIQLFSCRHAVHEACTKKGQCPICCEAAKFKVK